VSGLTKGNGIVGVSQRWGKSISQAGFKWIGMSQSARYVPSPVCLEQIHRQCNCPSTGATAKSTKAYKRNSKRSHLLPSLRCQPKSQYYKPNRTNWKSTVKTISKIYTPCPKLFPLTSTPGNLIWVRVTHSVAVHFANVELGQTYALTRAGGNRCLATTDTTPIRDTMPGGSGYSKLSVPKPKTRIHNIGCSQFSCLGSIGINKPKRHGTPNSNRATTKPLNKRTLVFWHIVSLTPRH